jgi:hypothetical protein
MTQHTEELLSRLEWNPGASDETVQRALENFPSAPPADYLEFMRRANGAEGELPGSWLQLWPLEKLKERNALYAVEEFAPGLRLIGSDGGSNGFALMPERDGMVFVRVPFIDIGIEDGEILGRSFVEFVEALGHSPAAPHT